MFQLRLLAPVMAVALTTAWIEARGAPATCASVDLDQVLSQAKPARAAIAQLTAEYDPRYAKLEPFTLARSKAEVALLEAKQAGASPEAVQLLQRAHDDAAKALAAARSPLDKALKQSRAEALNAVMALVGDAYQRLGREGQFALLFQAGEPLPAYVLDASMRREGCASKTDLTQTLIDALAQPGATAGR